MSVKQSKILESATRKKIDRLLENLKWNTDEESPDCNVFTERPKTIEQQKKLKGRKPDYVLYKSKTNTPIAIIETKKIGKNLDDALNDGINKYAKPLDIPVVFATDGIFFNSWHLIEKKELTIDDDSLNELVNEKTLLRFIDEGSNIKAISEIVKYTRTELIKIFDWANNLLRKEGLRNLDRFVEFSNILFLKLISEIEKDKEITGETRILSEKYCWDTFKDLSSDALYGYINNTVLPYLVDKYNKTGDVFQEKLKIKKSENLKAIVDKLSPLTLINTDSEIKGDAFEYFLKSLVMGNDLGEYFTPRHIVKIMVKLVDPKFGETIYDPACGTGGFLIETFKHIKKSCKLTKSNIKKMKYETVFGVELTDTARIAKMNMILTGDGHTNIKQYDSLEKPIKNKYDVVLTNFPFSQETDFGNLYGFDTTDANPIFLKHIMDSINDGGRVGVITFQGVLYDSNKTYVDLRKYLLTNFNLEAVIKLNNFVFRPYTGVHTSILIFNKGESTKKVWFFNVINDGFEKTSSKKGRKKIKQNDLELLENIWTTKESTNNSWIVSIDEIKKHNYNLNAETYKPRKKSVSEFPFIYLKDTKYFRSERGVEVGSNAYCDTSKGIHFIRVGDLTGKGKTKVHFDINKINKNVISVDKNDILLSFDGTIGEVKRGFEGVICAGIRSIKSINESEILNDFLYYMLQSDDVKKVMKKYRKESIIAHSGESFNHIKIPKPSIDYQRNFIKKVKKIDDKIYGINLVLESFKDNIIDDELFNFENDSNIPLDKIIVGDIQNGIYKPKSFYGSGIPIIRIDNIYDGQFISNSIKKLKLTQKELTTYKLLKNDIILNRVNSEEYIGKCCVFQNEFSDCVFESNIMRFHVNEKIVNPKFIVYYLSSKFGKKQILLKIKRAINQVSINQGDVKSILIPDISLSKQKEIVFQIDKQIETINNLKDIRDNLNKKLRSEINKIYSKTTF